MSIKVMTRVWELSAQRGSGLLLMLALADHAADDGICWPGIERLAHYCRLQERQTQKLLADLDATPELHIAAHAGGRSHSNLYLVTLGLDVDEIQQILVRRLQYTAERARLIAAEKGALQCTLFAKRVHSRTERVHSSTEKGALASAPEPLLTVNATPEELNPSSVSPCLPVTASLESWPAWELCLAQLKAQMSVGTYNTHLAGSTAFRADGHLTITTLYDRSAAVLDARLRRIIEHTVAAVAGQPLAVAFTAPTCLPVSLSPCLPVSLSTCLPVSLSTSSEAPCSPTS